MRLPAALAVPPTVLLNDPSTKTPWLSGLADGRSEEHTSELQSRPHLVCRLLLEKKNRFSGCRRSRSLQRSRIDQELGLCRWLSNQYVRLLISLRSLHCRADCWGRRSRS